MQDKEIKKLLIQIGLDDEEAAVYIAMLGLDSVSIRKIADKSNINRGKVYELLKNLVDHGLASKRHEGKRDYYVAESPQKILVLLQDKRKDLWKAQLDAKVLIPKLLASQSRAEGGPVVKYFDDDEGVVAILNDVLQTTRQLDCPEYLAYSSKPIRQYLYREFPGFTDKRIEEGVGVRVIAVGEGGDDAQNAERRWIDLPTNELTSYVLIYGTKVANISIAEDNTPYGVVVDDKSVADMHKLIFYQVWSKL